MESHCSKPNVCENAKAIHRFFYVSVGNKVVERPTNQPTDRPTDAATLIVGLAWGGVMTEDTQHIGEKNNMLRLHYLCFC